MCQCARDQGQSAAVTNLSSSSVAVDIGHYGLALLHTLCSGHALLHTLYSGHALLHTLYSVRKRSGLEW